MKKNLLLITIAIALFVFFNKSVKDMGFSVDNSHQAKPYTFQQRVEVLKYEKCIVCEAYVPCDNSAMDGSIYNNPLKTIDTCEVSLNKLENTQPPNYMNQYTAVLFDSAKNVFIFKAKSHIKEAKKVIRETGHPSGFMVNLAHFFEPRNCDAYGALDVINKQYNLLKVMYNKNTQSYDYVNCENLAPDDLAFVLYQYDRISN